MKKYYLLALLFTVSLSTFAQDTLSKKFSGGISVGSTVYLYGEDCVPFTLISKLPSPVEIRDQEFVGLSMPRSYFDNGASSNSDPLRLQDVTALQEREIWTFQSVSKTVVREMYGKYPVIGFMTKKSAKLIHDDHHVETGTSLNIDSTDNNVYITKTEFKQFKKLFGVNYKKAWSGNPWLGMTLNQFKTGLKYFTHYYLNSEGYVAHKNYYETLDALGTSRSIDVANYQKEQASEVYNWYTTKTNASTIVKFEKQNKKGLTFTNGILTKIVE